MLTGRDFQVCQTLFHFFRILTLKRANASPERLPRMFQAAQASAAVLQMSLLSPSPSSRSPLRSTAISNSIMAWKMDLPASKHHPARPVEQQSRTHNVVVLRMFPLCSQPDHQAEERAAAALESTALDLTAALLQAL